MTTHTIEIDEQLDRFVEDRVRSGTYQDTDSVVRAVLGLLKARTDRRQKKLERLRAAIQVGIDQVERGEGVVINDLDSWFDAIEAEL